jgi:hypothetical protein
MNACKGIFGFLFGHKYKARYTENDSTPVEVSRNLKEALDNYLRVASSDGYIAIVHDDAIEKITESFQNLNNVKTTYINDVCVRCGNTTKKYD